MLVCGRTAVQLWSWCF